MKRFKDFLKPNKLIFGSGLMIILFAILIVVAYANIVQSGVFFIIGSAGLLIGSMMLMSLTRKEEQLRAASLYTRSLIEASIDPLVTIGSDGKITDVNKATETVTGVPRDRLIGSDFSDYFTEPDKAREGYQQVFSKGYVKDYPLAIRHTSGHVTHVLYNASIYKNEEGKVQGIFAAARDITERKKSDEQLRATSLYARSLIEASIDPLVTISPDGKITDVNKATETVTGVPRDRLIGSDFLDYFTEPDKAREGYQQVFSKGYVKDYPLAILHTSGRVTHVLYNASIYKNEEGKVQGIFAAARDITERKRIEENLHVVIREISDAVDILASSSSEILAASTQLASGSAETATSISETTTTVEETKQTTQLSNQKAKDVSDRAQRAVQVAHEGRKSVDDTIEAMNRIKEQMGTIAESIVKLSEQSQVIGEIITTVSDIADQSNILAVNAAIEAAKAGEHGKGFAVVAHEVKSLAEQSKQATAQVRTILSDIQKATSASVMVTEQGTAAVAAGMKKSSETGESIKKLANSIEESVTAATQIAASSQQQFIGMDQIAVAMENIKKASEQNVTSSKRVETVAQNLHDLGQKLKQIVERIKM